MKYFGSLVSIGNLTDHQRIAIEDQNPIALSGPAGSGKSIVSIYKHMANVQAGQKALLLTYTKTLEAYFRALVGKSISPNTINRTLKFINSNPRITYDHIIVDEAQDVHYDKYTTLVNCTRYLSYGIDERQNIYNTSTTEASLSALTKHKNNQIPLITNYRNTKSIISFVQWLFEGVKEVSTKTPITTPIGNKPTFIVERDQAIKLDAILDLIRNYTSPKTNIGIICENADDVKHIYSYLQDNNIPSSYYIQDDSVSTVELNNVHVCTNNSSKGLEFDMVIIPYFELHKYISNKSQFFQSKITSYYVATTRAKGDLYLFINDINDIAFKTNHSAYCQIEKLR